MSVQFELLFRAAREKPVATALIGAGEFGLSLIAQSRRMHGLKVLAAADKDLARVAAALKDMGVGARRCAVKPIATEDTETVATKATKNTMSSVVIRGSRAGTHASCLAANVRISVTSVTSTQ